MIETKLKLTNGKTVKGFYFDEEDKRAFYENRFNIDSFKNRVERLERNTDLILSALENNIMNFIEGKFRKYIEETYSDKSFRFFDLQTEFSYSQYKYTVLHRLEAEGFIVHRGSGWYRKNANSESAEAHKEQG